MGNINEVKLKLNQTICKSKDYGLLSSFLNNFESILGKSSKS